MAQRQRVGDDEVVTAYRATGSVWKAGKQLGITGQSVWERLKLLGHDLARTPWTREEYDELRTLAGTCTIGEIARRLNRSYASVACKISRLGLAGNFGNRGVRARKVPRGAGLTKKAVGRLTRDLEIFDGSLRQFCRARGMDIEALVRAIQTYYPERWGEYSRTHSDIGEKTCSYCGKTFYPLSGKQKNCTRSCSAAERVDRQYFGGKRSTTIGLAEGVCQLCRRHISKGLSSHHVFGKANDPDNEFLIALCAGCHKLITMAATRSFVMDEGAWQDFIALAVMRKNARDFLDGDPSGLYVEVILEQAPISDEDAG